MKLGGGPARTWSCQDHIIRGGSLPKGDMVLAGPYGPGRTRSWFH